MIWGDKLRDCDGDEQELAATLQVSWPQFEILCVFSANSASAVSAFQRLIHRRGAETQRTLRQRRENGRNKRRALVKFYELSARRVVVVYWLRCDG